MTRSSEPRRRRKAAAKPKQGLKLTEDERLRFENYTLKLQRIQTNIEILQQQAKPIFDERMALSNAIGKRLEIPMNAYNVNLDTGDVTAIAQSIRAVEPPKENDDSEETG